MQRPQITTTIPTYRRPKMLRRAIESVLAQTYPHFQVMVLDNASGDETPEVVAGFPRRQKIAGKDEQWRSMSKHAGQSDLMMSKGIWNFRD